MNGGRRRVVLCSDYLDIGGTVKGMQEYALALDRNRYDVRVIGLLGGGVRAARLEAAGIPVEIADGDRSRLARSCSTGRMSSMCSGSACRSRCCLLPAATPA